jgi:hypothetical protein
MFAVYSTEEDLSLVPAYKTTHYLGIFTDIKLAEARVQNDKEECAKMHKHNDKFVSFYYIIKSKPDVAQQIVIYHRKYKVYNDIIYYLDSEEDDDDDDNDDTEKFTNIASVIWNLFYKKN